MNPLEQPTMQPAGPAAIDVGEIMRGIWRRRKMVILLTLVCGFLAFGYVTVTKPRFTAQAQVLIENLETPFSSSSRTDNTRAQRVDERDVLSQVEVIKSRDVARRVITALDLTSRSEFGKKPEGGLLQRLAGLAGFGSQPAKMTPQQRALARYAKKLTVYSVDKSAVIVIRFTSTDPKTSAQVANTLAETYVTSTREAQSEPTGRARNWLEKQIEALRVKVVRSEVAAEKFRAQAGLVKGTSATLSTQELSELNTQIILASAASSEAQAKAKSIRGLLKKTGSVEAASDVLNSPLIQRLREQYVQLRRTRAQLSATYLKNHPRMVAVREELADLGQQIRAEALKVVQGLEEAATVAKSREASLRASLASLKDKAGRASSSDVKLRELEREAAANRTLLETFLTRFSDASARQDLVAQPGLARIISRADIPTQVSFPKKGPIVMLASAAGLALGLGFAFLAEVMGASARLAQGQFAPLRAPQMTTERPIVAPAPEPVAAPAADFDPQLDAQPVGQPAIARAVAMHKTQEPNAYMPQDLLDAPGEPDLDAPGEPDAGPVDEMPYDGLDHQVAEADRSMLEALPEIDPMPLAPVLSADTVQPDLREVNDDHEPQTTDATAAVAEMLEFPNAVETAPAQERHAEPVSVVEAATAQPDVVPAIPRPLGMLPRIVGSQDAQMHALSVTTDPENEYASSLTPLAGWVARSHEQGFTKIGFASIAGAELDAAVGMASIARLLSAHGLRIIVVDADMSQAGLSQAVVLDRTAGLAEILTGAASFSTSITKDPSSRMHILTAGRDHQTAAGEMASPRMGAVLSALEHTYDLVLVHDGTITAASDCPNRTAAMCDGAIVFAPTDRGTSAAAIGASLVKCGPKSVQIAAVSTTTLAIPGLEPEELSVAEAATA